MAVPADVSMGPGGTFVDEGNSENIFHAPFLNSYILYMLLKCTFGVFQGGNRWVLPILSATADPCGSSSLYDAESSGGPGKETGHSTLS